MLALSRADDTERSLQSLAQKWNITEPSFDYDGLSFDLDYVVSDFITEEMVAYSVYDIGCKDGDYPIFEGTGSTGGSPVEGRVTGIIPQITLPTSTAQEDGAGSRSYELNVTLLPDFITTDSRIYREVDTDSTGQLSASIEFCVRFSLVTGISSPIEVNFLETIVTLTVDLTDGFDIGQVSVTPKQVLTKTANQAYEVYACQCNAGNQCYEDIGQALPNFKQGSIVKICVKPDPDAQADGIFMRRIDSFEFFREYTADDKVTQVAVVNGQQAGNSLTSLQCGPGWVICNFETLLFADFYRVAGAVLGTGIASMQFGGSVRRRLGSEGRNMQEDEDAGAAEFELNFPVESAVVEESSSASSMGVVAVMTIVLSGMAMLL